MTKPDPGQRKSEQEAYDAAIAKVLEEIVGS